MDTNGDSFADQAQRPGRSGPGSERNGPAIKLLNKEADSFAKDDNDIGCIPDLQLDLDLKDKTPV